MGEDRIQAIGSSQELTIMFELVANNDDIDPALISTIGHETVAILQQEGYTTNTQVYTGQKGGFFVEFVTTIQQIAIAAWNSHAAIAESIADLSGLITVWMGILPMLKRMRQAHEQLVGKEESVARPIKITVEIDGASLVIEASDVMQADAALKLALKYRSEHPTTATQVTTKSKVKVQGQIPARKRRKRR